MAFDYSVDFDERFGAGLGLGYFKLGIKGKSPIFDSEHNWKRIHSFDYISVPVFLKFIIDKSRKGFFYFGSSFDLLLHHKTVIKSKCPRCSFPSGNSQIENFVRTNHSLFIGAAWMFHIEKKLSSL